MNNGYIAVIDSGIGGFSCVVQAAKLLYGERFLYFGDNKNAPYGEKSATELYSLTENALAAVIKRDVKAVVIGCNTLSATVLPTIAKKYRLPFFGVYPPVGKVRGETFLFATPVTCSRYLNAKGVKTFPLKNLAADIERHKFDLSAVDLKAHLTDGRFSFPDRFPDAVILGCTHYFFVKNQFTDHFCPRTVLSGEEFTAQKLVKYLSDHSLTAKCKEFSIDFIGDNAEENHNFYFSVVRKMIFGE